jgi:hypothetical protein
MCAITEHLYSCCNSYQISKEPCPDAENCKRVHNAGRVQHAQCNGYQLTAGFSAEIPQPSLLDLSNAGLQPNAAAVEFDDHEPFAFEVPATLIPPTEHDEDANPHNDPGNHLRNSADETLMRIYQDSYLQRQLMMQIPFRTGLENAELDLQQRSHEEIQQRIEHPQRRTKDRELRNEQLQQWNGDLQLRNIYHRLWIEYLRLADSPQWPNSQASILPQSAPQPLRRDDSLFLSTTEDAV